MNKFASKFGEFIYGDCRLLAFWYTIETLKRAIFYYIEASIEAVSRSVCHTRAVPQHVEQIFFCMEKATIRWRHSYHTMSKKYVSRRE